MVSNTPPRCNVILYHCRFAAVLTLREPSTTSSSTATGASSSSLSHHHGSGAGTFSLVESNAFRRLTHLALATRQATDAGMRRYLAARLSSTAALLSVTRSDLEEAHASLASASAEVASLQATLASERSEAAASAAASTASHASELASLRSSYEERVTELRRQMEAQTAAREQVEVRRVSGKKATEYCHGTPGVWGRLIYIHSARLT